MKLFIKLISVLMTLAMLSACFYGCNETPPVETEAETTEAAPEGPALLENGKLRYALVRDENADQSVIKAVTSVAMSLRSIDSSLSYTDDFLMPGKTTDSEAFEILVGNTNRPESQAKYAELKASDWYVGVSGNKILILGGDTAATISAVKFFEEVLNAAIQKGGDKLTLDGIASEHLFNAEYAAKEISICGTPISEYQIRYSNVAAEEADVAAGYLRDDIAKFVGIILSTTKKATDGKAIIIGSTDDESKNETAAYTNTLDYTVKEKDGNIIVTGGNAWALVGGIKRIVSDYILTSTDITAGISITGNAEGVELYAKTGTSNLRIMTNNVWACDNNNATWKAMGEDCSAENRAKGLAKTYAAYHPDIICFQEMTKTMLMYLKQDLKKYGLEYKTLLLNDSCNTPIIYNADVVTVEDSGYHFYTYGNNGNSKSYLWGYFKLNSNGKHFIALSTHLWWKSDDVEPQSSTWRKKQAEEIVALSEKLIAQYNCPMFIQGDLNCNTSSTAIQALYSGGFSNNYNLATLSKDNIRGHHKCSPEGFERVMYSGTYLNNGIDHMLTKNLGTSEVQAFRHVVVDFFFNLTDHFPIITDVNIQ